MREKFKTKINYSFGFTLIEFLVSMSVFGIVVIAFLGLLVSTFKEQQKSLAKITLVDSGAFVTEYVTKDLRLVHKDRDGTCLSARNYNYENPGGDITRIKFINYDGVCEEFYKDGNTFKVKIGTEAAQAMFPNGVIVERAHFLILGDGQENNLQPKVVFVLKIRTSGQSVQTLDLQTTVSQRELDVFY